MAAETNSTETFSSSSSDTGESSVYMTVSSASPKRRAGRTKFKETRHPVFKGVRRRGRAGRWVCELRDPNNNKSRIWVGTFATAEIAARAHDVAAIALRGRSGCLNFADSAWRLPVANSSSHEDICRAAALATEQFKTWEELNSATDNGDRVQKENSCTKADDAATEILTSSRAFDVEYDTDVNWGLQGYYYLAEGMLVDPLQPEQAKGVGWDEMDVGADVSLWSS